LSEPLRVKESRERETLELLREIRNLLKGAPLPQPPLPPLGTVNIGNLPDIKALLKEALEEYGVLKRATDWLVVDIDLAKVRPSPEEVTELANALSLTIFRNTGTFVLYLQQKDDTKKITVDALTYPQTLLIDWVDIQKVFITNTAQSGLTAQILKFFKA